MRNWLLGFLLASSSLGAQSLSIRNGTLAPDTVYLTSSDTIPLRLIGKTAKGGTVVPKSPAWVPMLHCVGGVYDAKTIDVKMTELDCGLVPGYLVATAIVSGIAVKDSVYVARPSFVFGSALGACLSTSSAQPVLRYASRDSSLILAVTTTPDGRYISVTDQPGIPDSGFVSFGWPVGSKTFPFRAIACLPGYRATDVTTSSLTTWMTDNSAIASVSKGTVTWKMPRGFRALATWRGWSSSWEVR